MKQDSSQLKEGISYGQTESKKMCWRYGDRVIGQVSFSLLSFSANRVLSYPNSQALLRACVNILN